MANTLADKLENDIETQASWNTPCTFNRLNKIPIDSKSCFKTMDDLMNYINDDESTAYPGQIVAVTTDLDGMQGGYVLMSNDEDEQLRPIQLTGIKKITLRGSAEGGEDNKIEADVNGLTGEATLVLDEMEFDTLESNELLVNGFNIGLFMMFLEEISKLNEIEEGNEEYTLNDIKDKFNYILRTIKRAIEVSKEPEDESEEESTEG